MLEQVWAHPSGVTAREALDRLPDDLAYNTVMTILNRLWTKGLLRRDREGRAYRYQSVYSEAELMASRMNEVLGLASDRPATLSRFVSELSTDDGAVLRDLLDEGA